MPLLSRHVYPSLVEWKIKSAEKGFLKFCYKLQKEVFEKAYFIIIVIIVVVVVVLYLLRSKYK